MCFQLALLKTKEDKRVVVVVAPVVADKKGTTKDKRAKDTTALITTGSEIMKRLGQLGRSELARLKIDELYALLVNSDPLGSIPRPNKKEGQEKANLMSTVQAALRHFSAVAAASTPQAPPLPPIPFTPATCEGETIPNLQVEGGREMFLPVFAPVFSYATNASADDEAIVAYA